MTLVRFNHPGLLSTLANEAYAKNLWDSNLETFSKRNLGNQNNYHLVEEDTFINLEMVVTGFSKEDIHIELDNDVLTVKSKEAEGENKRSQFASAFERHFKLTKLIDQEAISAHTENGILYINLPKTAEAIKKPARSIEIA